VGARLEGRSSELDPAPRYRYIGKNTASSCYIAAWFVWVIALMAFVVARRYAGVDHLSLTDPNLTGLIVIIEVLAAAMVVCWIAALVRLWKQHDWGWFVAVLILHVVGLGIVGMVAYAGAGPVDVDVSKPGVSS